MADTILDLSWKELKKQGRPFCRCRYCRRKAYQTYWQPDPGIDHNMREYICELGHKNYQAKLW